MKRRDYKHYEVNGRGGINQQAEIARPRIELADARNLQCPDGIIEDRPGYFGVNSVFGSAGSATNPVVIKYTGSNYTTYTMPGTAVLGNMAVGDYVYIGFDDDPADYNGISLNVTTNKNSNDTLAKFEYWNGSAWVYLTGTALSGGGLFLNLTAPANIQYFHHQGQTDWVTTTVNSQTKYFVRALLTNEGFDISTEIDDVDFIAKSDIRGLFPIQYSSEKNVIIMQRYSATTAIWYERHDSMYSYRDDYLLQNQEITLGIPPTIAVVPEFDEAFTAYNKLIIRHTPNTSEVATVENRDFAVGDNAPYESDYIKQLGDFPEADLISYYDNRFWFSGIKNDPFGIRWSAPAPFHKVIPVLSREVLMEEDNSPITGMAPLGEQMVVFKQDSIWVMLNLGVDAFDLRQYTPKRVVAGVGCVSNSSIQKIRNHLVFLSEDGVYAFDGTPNIKKISDRVQDTVNSINAGQRPFSVAVNWKKRNLYLLAVATSGVGYNDTILAWDYKNDTWWIWDSFNVRFWAKEEDSSDNEIIYFGESNGRIFQLDGSKTDNGSAISSYAVTHRHGRKDNNRKILRWLEVESTNKAGSSVTLEPLVNDEAAGTSGITGTADYTDSNDTGCERRRNVRIGFRREFDWVQAKISHSTKNSKFKLSNIDFAYYRKGIR